MGQFIPTIGIHHFGSRFLHHPDPSLLWSLSDILPSKLLAMHCCAVKAPSAKQLYSPSIHGSFLSPTRGSIASLNLCFGGSLGIRFHAVHALPAMDSHEQPLPRLHDADPSGCRHSLVNEMQVSPHGLPLQHCRLVAFAAWPSVMHRRSSSWHVVRDD